MAKCVNVDEMKILITRINSTYDCLTFLCTKVSNAELVLCGSITKLYFDFEYWEFKLNIQQCLIKNANT